MAVDKALPLLGMVLVTHGRLADEMVRAMEHVVGPQRAIGTVCIGPNDNMEMRRKEIADAIRKVDEAVTGGDAAAAKAAFAEAAPKLMRAAQKGVLHKKTASRKVSRLAARVKALSA